MKKEKKSVGLYAAFEKKYPRLTTIGKIFFSVCLVYWLLGWYYDGIQGEIDKLNRDKVMWDHNQMFKQYLKDFNKSYASDIEYEKRKETFIKNFKIARHQAGSALMKLN